MVEDKGLPFPESVAASEIHKAGQRGADAAIQLFKAMGVGALIKLLGDAGVFRASNDFQVGVGKFKESFVRLGLTKDANTISAGGITTIAAPAATPAYMGVGYIIGPELGALNFAGGLLAWGLFVPLLVFFLGPNLIDKYTDASGVQNWAGLAGHLYRYIVRPIAVGGMLVGACFTLWKMRKNLISGIKRGVADVKKSAAASEATERTEKDLSFKVVLMGIAAVFVLMVALYYYFTGVLGGALLAAVVMLVTGFFFAAVSGNLVGLIGSSNNPISGLTLATTIVAALTMVIIGVKGTQGVAAVLGVAAVVCVSSAVAGEMLQDLKVGHILGGTPWKMQVGDVIGVVIAGAVMFFPLYLLHTSDLAQQPAHRRLRRQEPPGPAGGPHGGPLAGDRRRRDGLAARPRRDRDGDLAHPRPGQEPDALLGRHVPPARDDVRHLHRRPHPRLRRQARRQARFQRGPEGARRERGRPRGLRPDRRARRSSASSWRASWPSARTTRSRRSPPSRRSRRGSRFRSSRSSRRYLIYVPLGKAGAADEPAPPTAIM